MLARQGVCRLASGHLVARRFSRTSFISGQEICVAIVGHNHHSHSRRRTLKPTMSTESLFIVFATTTSCDLDPRAYSHLHSRWCLCKWPASCFLNATHTRIRKSQNSCIPQEFVLVPTSWSLLAKTNDKYDW